MSRAGKPGAVPASADPAAGPAARPGSPVRVGVLNGCDLVLAGLTALMAQFTDRVLLFDLSHRASAGGGSGGGADVVLYDAATHPRHLTPDLLLSPTASTLVPSTRLVVLVTTTRPWTAHVAGATVDPTVNRVVDPVVTAYALNARVNGIVTTSTTAQELVETLERVHRGEQALPRETAAQDGVDPARAGPEPGAGISRCSLCWSGKEHGLSARESQVVALICRGLSNPEIATRTHLSINTIKTYVRSTYRTIDVHTRAQAVIWGFTHGFEGPEQQDTHLPGERLR